MSIYSIQNTTFNIIIGITYFLIALFITGYYTDSKIYLTSMDYYVKIYISLFLIYRFNPFRKLLFDEKIVFTDLDRKIAYSSGLMLFVTTTINQVLLSYLDIIKSQIVKFL